MSHTDVVVVLSITHRHGTDISVYRTKEGAQAALVAYAREWWGDWVESEAPEDDDQVVAPYFDAADGVEYYEFDTVALQP